MMTRGLLPMCATLLVAGTVLSSQSAADESSSADAPQRSKVEFIVAPQSKLAEIRQVLADLPRDLKLTLRPEGPRDADQRQHSEVDRPDDQGRRDVDRGPDHGRPQASRERGPGRPGAGEHRDGDRPNADRRPAFRPPAPQDRGRGQGPRAGRERRVQDPVRYQIQPGRGPRMQGPAPDSHAPTPPIGPGRDQMHAHAMEMMQAVVNDKLNLVEKAMREILQAKQEAMDAKVSVVQMEARVHALEETTQLRLESAQHEAELRAELGRREIESQAEREIQQARQEATEARREVDSLQDRIGELEEENQRLRDELEELREQVDRLEDENAHVREDVERRESRRHDRQPDE